jgi:hypothetical protein
VHILYLGHFDRSWTTETHLARELEGLGHTVDRMPEPRAASQATLAELEARARSGGAGLVLWTRVHTLPADATQLWRRLEADGIVTASYHLDLYYGIRRPAGAPSSADPFWSTGTVFTADGDHVSAAKFAAAGINHRWMPPAVVSDEAVPGTPRRHFQRAPVVFVGQPSVSYPKEWPWRRELTTWLRHTYRGQFAHWPRQRPVRDRDLNDLYASATVVVGDSLCPPGHGRYWSDRLTETIGRGGFLLMPWIDGIEDQGFVDGQHLRFYQYGDTAGLKELIDHYLAHPDEARAIANRGQAFVAEHHTYRHRMAAMLDQLGLGKQVPA